MAISCVYCGGSHDTAVEVRACWVRTDGAEVVSPADGPDAARTDGADLVRGASTPDTSTPDTSTPDTSRSTVTPRSTVTSPPASTAAATIPARPPAAPRLAVHASVAHRAAASAERGPAALGRNVVVRPGDGAPAAWGEAPRVVVPGAGVDVTTLIDTLRRHADERRGCIIELDDVASNALDHEEHQERPPHELGPRFTFDLGTLAHLVWTNAVDARDGDATWVLLDEAIALGARPALGSTGDIVLPGGAAAWLDGGPIRFTGPIDGVAVLHRIAVEHRSLRPFGDDNTTSADLADDQRAAVAHAGGAARIIAPAGSGKTRVLTERARHLVRAWNLPESAVCLVAFNKRAQEEIRDRTVDLSGLQVRTLNSMALAIVNGTAPFAAQAQPVRTIDEGAVRAIIGRLVSFPRKRNADPVAPWIEALSLARLGLRDPDDVEALYDGDVDGFARVYPQYRAELAAQRSVDFDEQVQRAIELLLRDPLARRVAQRACRLLLVDEFQDLTPAHLLLVRLLAGPDAAVFGVGDDDQTIYGYNGADPAWLIEFAALFPGAGEHPLEVNYRCPAGIVSAADVLLRHNRRRVAKRIRAAGTEPGGWSLRADGDAVASTVEAVAAALDAGRATSEIAVLARVNSLLAPVHAALGDAGTPLNGGVGRDFLERTSVRAGLAWLRLATARSAHLAPSDVAEALRRPARPLHPNVARWVGEQSSVDGLRRLAKRLTNGRDPERVEAFADDVERLQAMVAGGATTGQLFDTLHDKMGLASTVATLDAHRHGMNRASQSDDLTALAQLARRYDDPRTFAHRLHAALDVRWQPGGVTLATVHRVKGQEWPVVVVHNADADQFPHRLAEDREEERRLFHVALTRASAAATITVDGQPSPFIAELTTEPTAGGDPEPPAAAPQRSRLPPPPPSEQLAGDDAALFEALRAVRRQLAGSKPAYTVVADATLVAIATGRPTTLGELSRIRGIGPSKLDQYGSALLAAVEDAS